MNNFNPVNILKDKHPPSVFMKSRLRNLKWNADTEEEVIQTTLDSNLTKVEDAVVGSKENETLNEEQRVNRENRYN